jgi:hypothetical protein
MCERLAGALFARQNRWWVTLLRLGTTSRSNWSRSSSGDSQSRPGSELHRRDRHVHGVDEAGVEKLPDGRGPAVEP